MLWFKIRSVEKCNKTIYILPELSKYYKSISSMVNYNWKITVQIPIIISQDF